MTVNDVFDAIADDVRRAILVRLHNGPLAVNDIVADFTISRPAISRHIRVLRECGLITVEMSGRVRRCHVVVDRLAEIEIWLAQFRSPWEHRLDALATEVVRTRRDRHAGATHPAHDHRETA